MKQIYIAIYHAGDYDEDGWYLAMSSMSEEDLETWVQKQDDPDKFGIGQTDLIPTSETRKGKQLDKLEDLIDHLPIRISTVYLAAKRRLDDALIQAEKSNQAVRNAQVDFNKKRSVARDYIENVTIIIRKVKS